MSGTHRLTFSLVSTDSPTITSGNAGGGTPVTVEYSHVFTDGLNVGQVGHVYEARTTLAASGTTTLDLYGGLTSDTGEPVNGSKLRSIAVLNEGPGAIQLTRPAANGVPLFIAASDGIELEEGDVFAFASSTGKTITNTTAQDLTITETGAVGATFRIMIGMRGV